MTPRDGLAAAAMIVIWAVNFIAGKLAVDAVPPLFTMALRFGLVALLLLPFLRVPPCRWRDLVAVGCVLGFLHFALLFTGLSQVQAGPVAMAGQLTVPFSALLAWIAFGERLAWRQYLGIALAFVGVWLLGEAPTTAPDPFYFALVVAGAFCWSLGNIQIKRLAAMNPFQLNGWIAWIAWPLHLAASLAFEDHQWDKLVGAGWLLWGGVVYMAVAASIVGYGLWYHLLGRYEVNRLVPLTLVTPVLAVVLAVIVLGEPLDASIVGGSVLTLAGVGMIQFFRPQNTQISG